MSDRDGGPAFVVCGKESCNRPAERKQGHQHLCGKHYRFGQMRANAKRHGKAVPSEFELEAMCTIDTHCADCGNYMTWLAVGNQQRVVTLQHYRDGTMGIYIHNYRPVS